jgi:hypothetical protein
LELVFLVRMMHVATVFASRPEMKKEAFANFVNINNQHHIIFATAIVRCLFCTK